MGGATDAMAVVALVVSVTTAAVGYVTARRLAVRTDYHELERTSEIVHTLALDDDRLNKLFFTETDRVFPPVNAPLQDLGEELRALVRYGSIVLDFFEQYALLCERKGLPEDVAGTWHPWIESCARAPHFLWVWDRSRDEYSHALAGIIENARRIRPGYVTASTE